MADLLAMFGLQHTRKHEHGDGMRARTKQSSRDADSRYTDSRYAETYGDTDSGQLDVGDDGSDVLGTSTADAEGDDVQTDTISAAAAPQYRTEKYRDNRTGRVLTRKVQVKASNTLRTGVPKRVTSIDVQTALHFLGDKFLLSEVLKNHQSNINSLVPLVVNSANLKTSYTDLVLQESVKYLFNDKVFTDTMRTKLIKVISNAEQGQTPKKTTQNEMKFESEETKTIQSLMPVLCELMVTVSMHIKRRDELGGDMTLVYQAWKLALMYMGMVRDAIRFANRMGYISGTIPDDTVENQMMLTRKMERELLDTRVAGEKLASVKNRYDIAMNEIKQKADQVNASFEDNELLVRRLEQSMKSVRDTELMAIKVLKKSADIDEKNKTAFQNFIKQAATVHPQHARAATVNLITAMMGGLFGK